MSRAMDGYIQNEARGIGNWISFFRPLERNESWI